MNLCTVDWMAWAAWIGALATAALAYFAYRGLKTWRTQFLKQRDHDLALIIVRAISHSYVIFDELRSPVPLFSDSDVPIPPPEAHGEDPDFQHRKMLARYKARTIHLSDARERRTVPLLEVLAIWDDEDYTVKLGDLINSLATVESKVIAEAQEYVESFRLAYQANGEHIDMAVLFSPADAGAEDPTGAEYEAIRNQILDHLEPKLRMK